MRRLFQMATEGRHTKPSVDDLRPFSVIELLVADTCLSCPRGSSCGGCRMVAGTRDAGARLVERGGVPWWGRFGVRGAGGVRGTTGYSGSLSPA